MWVGKGVVIKLNFCFRCVKGKAIDARKGTMLQVIFRVI